MNAPPIGPKELHQRLSEVVPRLAGSVGERAMLDAVAGMLPESLEKRVEGFVGRKRPVAYFGAHLLGLIVGGFCGFWSPLIAAFICGVLTVSLAGEWTGQFKVFRWVLPRVSSYNLVARIRADEPIGSVVIVAPLDMSRWRLSPPTWLRRWTIQSVFLSGVVVTALIALRSMAPSFGLWGLRFYVISLVILVVVALSGAVLHRRTSDQTVDASAPASLVQLAQRLHEGPSLDLDVWMAFTGCRYAFHGGMEAFLRRHRRSLVGPALVIGLDEPGAGALLAAVSEGALWPRQHRPTGPALMERLRWAGLDVAEVDLPRSTDAHQASLIGFRSLSLVGAGGESSPESESKVADVLKVLIEWYSVDLAHLRTSSSRIKEQFGPTDSKP